MFGLPIHSLNEHRLVRTVVGGARIGRAARGHLIYEVGRDIVVAINAYQPQCCEAFHRHLRTAVDVAEVHHRDNQHTWVCRCVTRESAPGIETLSFVDPVVESTLDWTGGHP